MGRFEIYFFDDESLELYLYFCHHIIAVVSCNRLFIFLVTYSYSVLQFGLHNFFFFFHIYFTLYEMARYM